MSGELSARLEAVVRATPSLMHVLTTVRGLALPDWLVFSGAVYQPVLNHLTGRDPDYGIKDYDLGYFDASDTSYEAEDVVIEALRDLARWLYRQLEREYAYLTSDAVVDEAILANGYTFTEAGQRFG